MWLLYPNFAPITDVKGEGGLSVEDTIDFLKDDESEEKIDLDDKKGKEKKESIKKEEEEEEEELKEEEDESEETDELKEIEEELEEPTDEQLELIVPVRKRDIIKKYPNLFKDFPYLEKAYYREQQFTELLPTIEDAKSAVDKAATLDNVEKDLMSGDTKNLLLAAKNENPKAFGKIVDNYLSVLADIDEKAYHHVIGNTIKHTIIAMVKEGNTSGNDNLKGAAQILNQFVFGSSDFSPPTKLVKDNEDKDDSSKNELNRERQEFTKQKFESTRDELNTKVNNAIKSTIDGNIDPKDSMSAYVKKNASREALESLNDLIDKDSRFKIILDRLWENAVKNNFNKESTDRIRSAYLSKAKTLLPAVIKTARNEALKGIGKRVHDDEPDEKNEEKESSKRTSIERKSTPQLNSGKIKSSKDIPRGMKSIDFLMQD